MLSSILKIIPRLDSSALRKMERDLTSRFAKIAKGFGKGLTSVLKGGGIAAIGLGLIDKLLNPLKETQEAIERTLSASDDIATNARQFGTTSGKLLKLAALGQATGLDQDTLFMLINKFQTAVAEAQNDPNAPSSVRNYIGTKDFAQGFFDFSESIRGLETNQRLLIEKNVFGEKNILKAADFMQSDLAALYMKLGLNKISTEKLTKNNNRIGDLNDLTNELQARRKINDVAAKAGVITPGIVYAKDRADALALAQENQRIANYKTLTGINDTVIKIQTALENGIFKVGAFIEKATPLIDPILKFLTNNPVGKISAYIFGRGGK